jgi:hypothetical protein
MSRPKKPITLLQKALDSRSVTDIYWAFIALSADELRNEGKLVTFSGNHLVSFLSELSKLQAEGKTEITDDQAEDLKLWAAAAK